MRQTEKERKGAGGKRGGHPGTWEEGMEVGRMGKTEQMGRKEGGKDKGGKVN